VLDLAVFRALVQSGFSFLKLQLLRYVSLMLDKWLVGWFLGALALGQYSFLLITFLVFTAFAGVYNAVIIPRLISEFSKKNDLKGLVKTTRTQAVVFLLGSLMLGPVYLWASGKLIYSYFYEYLFPYYLISIALIFSGSAFHVATHFFDSLFYAMRKQTELTMMATLSLLLFVVYYLVAGNLLSPSVMWFSLAFFLSKVSWFLMTLFRVMRINVTLVTIA
jgi:O-antigen/teichoic acid export membrane protein